MARKNIQVIDGADNCTYDIFSIEENEFNKIFPGDGQDIEFAEDFIDRMGEVDAEAILAPLWESRENKKFILGIHGTLFYGLGYKKKFYPTKKDDEMIVVI